jgi:hypothetical protein
VNEEATADSNLRKPQTNDASALDGAFWILDDEGVLSVYEYKDDRFERLAARKILPGADSWGPIAFAGGLMILRDSTSMVCLDLRNEVQQ